MAKSLIVYFSQGGNTRKCAEALHSLMDSDLFELVPEVPYPRGYGRLLKETKKEADEKSVRELNPVAFNPADYDRLFIGCPNWWGFLPAPVRTFITKTDFSGKEIAFFITHGGSVAERIAERTGADIFEIVTVQEYPEDYNALLDFARDEQRENARPELAEHIENMDIYDVIFLGYPNWWSDMPMPLYSFLDEYDLSGKTIMPFVTSGGSGFSRTIRSIENAEPEATVLEWLSIRDRRVHDSSTDRAIEEWINRSGLF